MNKTDHESTELSQITAQFIKEIADRYQRDYIKILDFGCGTGQVSRYVQELFWNAQLIGVDQSEKQIDFAKQEQTSITFKQINELLPFADQTFDLVYSVYVFHHIDRWQRIDWIKQLARVTKKNGLVIILELNPFHLPTFFHFIFNKEEKNSHIILPHSLKKIMKQVGLPTINYYPSSVLKSSIYAAHMTIDQFVEL